MGFAVVLAAMARAVPPETRSLAMGPGTAAGSAGQFLLVPVTHVFLHSHGWANAYPFLAVAAALMIPPPGCPGASSPYPRTSCAGRSAARSAGRCGTAGSCCSCAATSSGRALQHRRLHVVRRAGRRPQP
ncbi:hypothetical protein CFP66_37100 [Pseudonocardia sp. MH-G8]|nr:hypothetical protein CFP66_37100 [Pseudonocardia sp. MH-G8]